MQSTSMKQVKAGLVPRIPLTCSPADQLHADPCLSTNTEQNTADITLCGTPDLISATKTVINLSVHKSLRVDLSYIIYHYY